MVIGDWLLVSGYAGTIPPLKGVRGMFFHWLLVTGYWLLVTGYAGTIPPLRGARGMSLHLLLVTGYLLLVTCYLLLVASSVATEFPLLFELLTLGTLGTSNFPHYFPDSYPPSPQGGLCLPNVGRLVLMVQHTLPTALCQLPTS